MICSKRYLLSGLAGFALSLLSPEAVIAQSDLSEDVSLNTFEQADCVFEIPQAIDREVECGFVKVPAFHAQSDLLQTESGDFFELPIVIFRSAEAANAEESVEQDPVIYLHGGPGYSLIPNTLFNVYYPLSEAVPNRDIIMFEQRGTSFADPQFVCNDFNQYIATYSGAVNLEFVKRTRRLVADCIKTLRDNIGIDFRAFNSLEHAADVEAIRKALGIEQWNVFGSSYGSKLGLVLLREYPDSIRSIVLGSILPLPVNTLLNQQASYETALKRMFAVCEADENCDQAYPQLEETFKRVVIDLERNPLELGSTPESSLTVDGGRFAVAIYDLFSAGVFIPSVPKVILAAQDRDKAFLREVFGISDVSENIEESPSDAESRQENSDMAATQTEETVESEVIERASETTMEPEIPQFNSSPREAVFVGYMCNEEIPFVLQDQFVRSLYDYWPIAQQYWSRPTNSPALYDFCNLLEIDEPITDDIADPVVSDKPALLINGGLDPITGPDNALMVAENLTNEQLVIIPNGSHGVSLATECSRNIMAAFIDQPTEIVDDSCIDKFDIGFTTDEVDGLEPFQNEAVGLAGVRPVNWVEASPGVFLRYIVGRVSLTQTKVLQGKQQALNIITTADGQEENPQPTQTGQISSHGLDWTLYELERRSGVKNFIAITPTDSSVDSQTDSQTSERANDSVSSDEASGETTFAVVLTLREDTQLADEYYYKTAFLPAVQALRPLGED